MKISSIAVASFVALASFRRVPGGAAAGAPLRDHDAPTGEEQDLASSSANSSMKEAKRLRPSSHLRYDVTDGIHSKTRREPDQKKQDELSSTYDEDEDGGAKNQREAAELLAETDYFWGRGLGEDAGSLSMTPPPTRPPTPPPTSSPVVPPPTPAPVVPECTVDATITCVSDDDGPSCDQLQYPGDDECSDVEMIVAVTYIYTIANVGDLVVEITEVDVTRNDETTSFLDLVQFNPLPSSASTSVVDTVSINLCTVGTYTTGLSVEADPPVGDSCMDTDEYVINIEEPVVPCIVEAFISCRFSDGSDCGDTEPPSECFSTEDPVQLSELTYTYEIVNVGTVDLTVTELERDFNGDTVDLLPRVPEEAIPLLPGDAFNFEEVVEIDLCIPDTYSNILFVEADPACMDTDEYVFEIEEPVVPDPTPAPGPEPTPNPVSDPTPAPVPSTGAPIPI